MSMDTEYLNIEREAAYLRGFAAGQAAKPEMDAAVVELLLPLLKEKLEDEWEQGNIGQYEYDDGGDWDWKQTWDWIHNTDLPQFDDTVDSVEPTNAWVVAYRAVCDPAQAGMRATATAPEPAAGERAGAERQRAVDAAICDELEKQWWDCDKWAARACSAAIRAANLPQSDTDQ